MLPVYEEDITYIDSDSEDSSDTVEVEEMVMSGTKSDEEESTDAAEAG